MNFDRTICFRGKSLETGEWVEGHVYTQVFSPDSLDEEWHWYIKPVGSDICGEVRVDPFTVTEYTGLDDKNGRKIFEGDLVKLDGWEPPAMQISFIEGAFCLADADEVGEYCGDIHYIHHAGINQTTVVGNIYDNPEMIRKAKNGA